MYFYASGAALIFRHLEYKQTIWKRNGCYRKIFIFTDYPFFLSVSINIFNGIESMIFIISLPWYRASTYFMYNLNLCSIDSMYSSKAVIMWFSNIHSLIHSICKILRYSYQNCPPLNSNNYMNLHAIKINEWFLIKFLKFNIVQIWYLYDFKTFLNPFYLTFQTL